MFGARFDDAGSGRSFMLKNNLREIVASEASEVVGAIRSAAEEAAVGNWVAGYVTFDAAPGFDDALVVQDGYNGPLVWFGVFGDSVDVDPPCVTPMTAEGYSVSRWVPAYDRTQYGSAFTAVHRHIEFGDSYQVNLTFPFRAAFSGQAESPSSERSQLMSCSPSSSTERCGRWFRRSPQPFDPMPTTCSVSTSSAV